MTQLRRIAFIGNSLPRRCGIATFTTDLRDAVANAHPGLQTGIIAMNDHGYQYDYPPTVMAEIDDDRIQDYLRAADVLNAGSLSSSRCSMNSASLAARRAATSSPCSRG